MKVSNIEKVVKYLKIRKHDADIENIEFCGSEIRVTFAGGFELTTDLNTVNEIINAE